MLLSFLTLFFMPLFSYAESIESRIDTIYTSLESYVHERISTIPLQSMKPKQEKRIWKRLELSLLKKIKFGDESEKLLYQWIWSKVIERNSATISMSTSDLVQQRSVINAINAVRNASDLNSLNYNSRLTQAAYRHALDLSEHFPYDADGDGSREIIWHVGTDGTRVLQRAYDAGYYYSFLGENIAYNQVLPSQVLADWMDSPTHYDNIVAPKAVDIGVAKVGPYWVMVIGAEWNK